MRLNPFIGFLALLFVLLMCASVVGIKEGLTTYFTFVPRWEGRHCGPDLHWEGPRKYPSQAPFYSYVRYDSEGFLGAEQKDASLLIETAGTRKDLKTNGSIEGDPILENPPNKPSPVNFANRNSYLLLEDELKGMDSGISCVNSRSCFASDFGRLQEKTGNFRQLTNNYKRGYPDSCSSPFQELVNSFYDSKGVAVDAPKNCI